jgi:putative chitinase
MATDRETELLRAAYASGITSRTELANFMAQVGHESYGLTRLEEGFRYTKGSWQISSNVRSALREGPEALEEARLEALQGRPERLAELMYGGRMGNDEPGDGYRYRGRGYIQLTGKDQYSAAGDALGLNLVENPELAAAPENAARIATWYWQNNVPQAAREDARAAGAAINGRDPPNGLSDRETRFTRWQGDITPELMEHMAQGRLGQPVPGPTQEQTSAAPVQGQSTVSGPRSFEDVMRVMLPPQSGVTPHMTSDYGQRTLNGRQDHHGGVDFNYRGGQAGLNLQHPTVRSPVSGEVVFSGGQYGTVKIRDGEGNLHEILHLDSRSVQVTNPPTRVQAGDPIGTMGGRGPNGAGQYAQHVHYQIRDPSGRTVDPERFWDGRTVESPTRPAAETRTPRSEAMADGVLRQGERGAEVVAAQQALNQLGYTGRNGQPLETRSGIYGAETRHAVEDFQRRHGLKPDGLIGDDTRAAMATAAQRPLLSEATHPSHRLYAEIARQLPPGTRPEVAANVTLQALENGITSPDRLARVDVRGNDVFVMGSTPGDRVKVDLNAPTPGMQQMSDHTRQQSQQLQPTPMRTQEPVQTGDTEVLRPRTMLA